jgi:hypothetical protein
VARLGRQSDASDAIAPVIWLALKVHYSNYQDTLVFDLVNYPVGKANCPTSPGILG